jgi:hypothetical protein
MDTTAAPDFEQRYQTHLQHLQLKGLQPKTIDAYARAIGAWVSISTNRSTTCRQRN